MIEYLCNEILLYEHSVKYLKYLACDYFSSTILSPHMSPLQEAQGTTPATRVSAPPPTIYQRYVLFTNLIKFYDKNRNRFFILYIHFAPRKKVIKSDLDLNFTISGFFLFDYIYEYNRK